MALGMAAYGWDDRPAAIDRPWLVHVVQPALHRLIRLRYFSLEIEGLEHVPRDGRAIFVQNHAGWFALDAFFLALAVAESAGPWRTPHFATADAALAVPVLGKALRRIGAVPASWLRRPERLPEDVRSCGIFPEGVQGNCKPFWHAYRMREWRRGFVRVAEALDAPVVPAAVLGGEECLPVAWTVKVLEPVIGSIVGLPLSWVPLPTRWKIVFHPAERIPSGRGGRLDAPACAALASRLRGTVQDTLDRNARSYPLARLSSAVRAVSARSA